MRRRTAVVAAAGLAVLFGACSSSPAEEPESTTVSATAEPLIVFGAASLQGAFDDLAAAFEDAHPEYPVAPLVYDGSQALATQIVDGADVDVVAFANEPSIAPLSDAELIGETEIFATNTIEIAVAPGNPEGIDDLADLASPDLSVVLCAPEVPCGSASQTLLEDASVDIMPASEETNVTSVLQRVASGEADAGLVYATDVAAAAGEVEGITPSNADVAINRYPIAVTTGAASPPAAEAFTAFVLSDEGQTILAGYGFESP